MKFLKYILLAYACLMTLQVQAQSKEYTLIHQGNRCFVQRIINRRNCSTVVRFR